MTWIMFNGLLMSPDTGSYFVLAGTSVKYFLGTNHQWIEIEEDFSTVGLAIKRFEELKKTLIRKRKYVYTDDGTLEKLLCIKFKQ